MSSAAQKSLWKKKHAKLKADPVRLAKHRARERAYKKKRYQENAEVRAKVVAASRLNYLTKQETPSWRAARILSGARKRAKIHGLEFNLTTEDVLGPLIAGRCEVTGLLFDLSRVERSGYRAHPFAPSIDRMDSSKGYTKDNVKIVCYIHNVAKNEWRADTFEKYVRAYVAALQ